MKYQDFIEIIKDHVALNLSHLHKVMVQPVIKNNGITYDGLVVIDPVLNISPTIYLNPYYHRYLNGVSMKDIFEDIMKTYHDNQPQQNFDVSLFCDYEKAQNRIILRLVNYEKNKELLLEIPHIRFYDLAIIFVCSVSDLLEEYATILIHNYHLNMWEIDLQELYQIAMTNTPKLLPYHFEHMEEYFARIMEHPFPLFSDLDIYLLTNTIKIHGSACMVYPGLLNHLANQLMDNLVIIPSSIHELLILPENAAKDKYSLTDFQAMISEANDTHLADVEILSDHAYIYIRETGELIY